MLRMRRGDEATFSLGVPRILEFERAIQNSKRTLLVLSPAYLAENYNQFIDLLAQHFGLETAIWPVIPLLLKPVSVPPRLSNLVDLDAIKHEQWESAIERLCKTLQAPVPGEVEIPECPYPGMEPFSEEEQVVLRWAEVMTRTPAIVADEEFADLKQFYNDTQLMELIFHITVTNMGGRIGRGLELVPEGFS